MQFISRTGTFYVDVKNIMAAALDEEEEEMQLILKNGAVVNGLNAKNFPDVLDHINGRNK